MGRQIYATAKRLAPRFAVENGRIQDWDAMRDYADLATGGDWDCVQLDLVADSMWRMLHVEPRKCPSEVNQAMYRIPGVIEWRT